MGSDSNSGMSGDIGRREGGTDRGAEASGHGPTLGGFPLVEGADRETLATRLARDVAARLKAAIAERGRASLVVSGGSTPLPFFSGLAAESLDWRRVVVTLADERWVPPGDEDSNESLVREHLLVGAASAARFVSLFTDAPTPEAGLATIEAALADVPRPFDVMVLGMGGDGHTASLHPDAPELEHAMTTTDTPLAAMHPPSVPQARITLTRPALVDSRVRLLHLTGVDKRGVLERALADEPRVAPIARVLDEVPDGVTIYWAP